MQNLRRIDSRRLNITPNEILSVACVRDESLRLPYFLEYHRKLGVDRFFIVDNDSQDGTQEYLLAQPDVHVFTTRQRYSESRCGVDWFNALLHEYAVGHWALTLDADEMLVYPSSERIGLRRLVEVFDRRNEGALMTFLLDMYADQPIRETRYRRGEPFIETCPFFDRDSYVYDRSDPAFAYVPVRGGVRARLFWEGYERDRPAPFLRKVPLVKWRSDLKYAASTHQLEGAVFSLRLTGALLHFKLFSDFCERAILEAERGEHWESAGQYSVYSEVILAQPDLNPWYEGSIRYDDSAQLSALGLAANSLLEELE